MFGKSKDKKPKKVKIPKDIEIQLFLMDRQKTADYISQKAMVEEIFKRQIKRGVIV